MEPDGVRLLWVHVHGEGYIRMELGPDDGRLVEVVGVEVGSYPSKGDAGFRGDGLVRALVEGLDGIPVPVAAPMVPVQIRIERQLATPAGQPLGSPEHGPFTPWRPEVVCIVVDLEHLQRHDRRVPVPRAVEAARDRPAPSDEHERLRERLVLLGAPPGLHGVHERAGDGDVEQRLARGRGAVDEREEDPDLVVPRPDVVERVAVLDAVGEEEVPQRLERRRDGAGRRGVRDPAAAVAEVAEPERVGDGRAGVDASAAADAELEGFSPRAGGGGWRQQQLHQQQELQKQKRWRCQGRTAEAPGVLPGQDRRHPYQATTAHIPASPRDHIGPARPEPALPDAAVKVACATVNCKGKVPLAVLSAAALRRWQRVVAGRQLRREEGGLSLGFGD